MDPCIGDMAESIVKCQESLPRTLTQAMSDSRPCMIASIHDPFTIANVNQAWCQAYGYSKDKVLHQNLVNLLGNSEPLEDFVLEQSMLLNESSPLSSTETPMITSTTHYTRDGTPVNEPLRVGTLFSEADVLDRYCVCVTEMDCDSSIQPSAGPAGDTDDNRMIPSREVHHHSQHDHPQHAGFGHYVGLA